MKNAKNIHYDNFGSYQCLEDIKNDSVDLCLITCGIEQCQPKHSFGPGVRQEYIFHFIVDGTGYLEQNGTIQRLGANDVFLIIPGQTTHYWADGKHPWHYMWVGFRGIKAPVYITYAGYSQERLTGHFENCLLLKNYIQQMIHCRTYTHSNDLKRNAALMEILALLIDNACAEPLFPYNFPKQNYIEQAKNYVEKNYQDKLSVTGIAESIGIDRSYLTRVFKEILHISPQEYIRQFRLNRAALMLQNSNNKISAIARAVGYHDYVNFSALFKEQFGMTPGEYRKMALQNAGIKTERWTGNPF